MHKRFVLVSVVFLSLLQLPGVAQERLEKLPSASLQVAQAPTGNYPVINPVDWTNIRTQNIPWSRPVIVNDPFDGNYLAVFDRNYRDFPTGRASIVSEWTRQKIRVFGLVAVERCGYFLACAGNLVGLKANYLEIKVGQQIFRLPGDGTSSFPVSAELATALANAPSGDALIRVSFDTLSSPVTSPIGAGTVKSWKVVYGQS